MIKFAELTQKQVEDFEKSLPPRDVRASISNGGAVRAAIKAGWLIDPVITEAEIDTMKPGKVNALAKAVVEKYNEAMAFDPL